MVYVPKLMKALMTLFLLIPSLSWGDAFLINLINEIHQKTSSKEISSIEGDFYLEQFSQATNVLKEYGSPCYQAQVEAKSKDVYDTNLYCLLTRTSLGIDSDEFTSNLKKIADNIIYFQNMILEGKFDYSDEKINKKRKNYINNATHNVHYLKKAITFQPMN